MAVVEGSVRMTIKMGEALTDGRARGGSGGGT